MPLIRLLGPVTDDSVTGEAGQVLEVDGPTASRLVSEQRAELIRDLPHEQTRK